MHVVHNDPQRLVLRGTPGRRIWMIALVVFGLVVMGMTAWFGWVTVVDTGTYLPLLPLSLGFLIGVAFALIGGVTLAVGRLQLTLDRASGRGSYEVSSPIIDADKPFEFDMSQIDGLAIESRNEARPGGEGFDSRVSALRLRVLKPRRVIVLDETQNGQVERLRDLAKEVSEWLESDPRLEAVNDS